jgi:hypothetical protein
MTLSINGDPTQIDRSTNEQVPVAPDQERTFSRRAFLTIGGIAGVSALLAACGGSGESGSQVSATTSAGSTATPEATTKTLETPPAKHLEGLNDPVAQSRAAQIISTFENSTTEVAYDYAKNIGDGRGILLDALVFVAELAIC